MKIYPIPNAGRKHRRVIRTRVMRKGSTGEVLRNGLGYCLCVPPGSSKVCMPYAHLHIRALRKVYHYTKKLGSHRGMGLGGKGIQCKVHARVLVSVGILVCCFFSGRLHDVEE